MLLSSHDLTVNFTYTYCIILNYFVIAGLVQRCIIVQRDENGYGLTVSGDNPVFVQSVKDGKMLILFGLVLNCFGFLKKE